MEYLVHRWDTFQFFLSPDELKQILSAYHLVIFNAHVPADYVESPLEEYIAVYNKLYKLLLSGEKILWEQNHSLFLHRGITSDLSNCRYGHLHTYMEKQYKRADFFEPVTGISPKALAVNIDEDGGLHCSSSCSYAFYPEGYMGTELQYPKMIQYKYGDDYEALRSTKELRSRQDFEELKHAIKRISRPLTIKTDHAERRLNIRVSDEVRYRLNGCYTFRLKGIRVK